MNLSRVISVRQNSKVIEEVVYIMHNAFRVRNNHALAHSLSILNNISVILVSPIDKHERTRMFFSERVSNYRDVLSGVSKRINFVDRKQDFSHLIPKDSHVVMDMYYLKEEKDLYQDVLNICIDKEASLDLVETNTIVPVTETSNKEEYSARTIRSKINKKKDQYLDSVNPVDKLFVGEEEALHKLREFVNDKLPFYHFNNDPSKKVSSGLSPYLKNGFISPLTIVEELNGITHDNKELFLEQLLIRRELSYNFVYYNAKYNEFDGMTYNWAYNTMSIHKEDKREYLYTIDDYITFNTHDEYFNTAMKEMVYHGTMHGYMRMYWCKKIIEWSSTFKEAYDTAMYLNNYYFVDGNSPNGYAGVAWCFGKHDRAWSERSIFGKIRYMNASGLKRKFDIEKYVSTVNEEVTEYGE